MVITSAGIMTALKGAGMATTAMNGLKSFFGKKNNSASEAARQQYEYNLALQKQAQDWNEYMYKNRYQMQAEDLEKAGINKRYSFGGASSPTSGQGSVGMPDFVNEQNNKVNQFIDGIRQAYELKQMSANTRNVEQKTATEQINTLLAEYEVINKNIQILKNQKELDQMDQRFLQEMEEQRVRILNGIEDIKLTKTKVNQTIAETKATEHDNVVRERRTKWYNDNPVLAGLAIGGQELSGTGKIATDATIGIGGGVIGKAMIAKNAKIAEKIARRKARR